MQVVEEDADGWRAALGAKVYAIHLTNDEVRLVAEASTPAAFLASLVDSWVPALGTVLAGATVISAFALKRVNAKHGDRGVIIRVNSGNSLLTLILTQALLAPASIRIMGPDS